MYWRVAGILCLVASVFAGCGSPPNGRLRLETVPTGLLVSTDGKPIGRTPFDVQLPPGETPLLVKRDAKTFSATVTIKSRQVTVLQLSVEEPAAQ